MAGPDPSVQLSFGYVNTCVAGFQGAFAERNAARLLEADPAGLRSLEELKQALDWLIELGRGLFAGEPPLRAGAEPDSRAKTLFGFFALLKGDTAQSALRLSSALNALQAGPEPAAAKLVAAGIARHAYSRQHYVDGLVRYGEAFGLEDLADRWRQQTLSCRQEVQEANAVVGRVKAAGASFDAGLRFELWNRAANLPGVFRSRLNDMLVVESLRGKPHDFAALGVGAERAEAWRRLGLDAETAGYWLCFGLEAEEAAAWINAGLADGGYAGAWKARGFALESALLWHNAGFPPGDAYEFVAAGCKTPEAARELLRALKGGRSDPDPPPLP